MSMKDEIQGGIKSLKFIEIIEAPVSKIITLVNENAWFFGDPPAGSEVMQLVADKLEELIQDAIRIRREDEES